jgi:glucokinase-like ROK family protein
MELVYWHDKLTGSTYLSEMKTNATADQVWVRRKNRAIILEMLRTNRTLSRAGLAAGSNLNPSTVSSIISELINENLVCETDLVQSATGRPGRLVALNPAGGCSIGVEINVDYVMLVLTDFTANILWRARQDLHPSESQELILERIDALIQQALDQGEALNLRPLGIGVGAPGLVNIRTGNLRLAPNLQWKNVPLQEIWTAKFALPVYVENEANAAALGEFYFGAAQGIENFVYLSAGIGLGGGVLLNGKLFRGSSGYASEVGHMSIDPNGELCSCGKRGCLETFVGPRAVVGRVRKTLETGLISSLSGSQNGRSGGLTFEAVIEAAQAGDPVALAALQEVGRILGIGIANLVNIFNPELVVLGGALNLASAILLPAVQQAVRENSLEPSIENLRITPSALGAEACVMGAVALVLDEILRESN